MSKVEDYFYIPAYLVSNENQRWATTAVPNVKNVLTVAGSGDQALFYKLAGAEIIDTYDIAYNAGVIQDIKFAAIKQLEHAEYEKLLTDLRETEYVMSVPQMNKLEPMFTEQSRETILFNKGRRIFSGSPNLVEYPHSIPTPAEYAKLKGTLTKPFKFIQSDLEFLDRKLPKKYKYDLINISNIFDCCYTGETQADILYKLSKHLNVGGRIVYLPQVPRFSYTKVRIRENQDLELVYEQTLKKQFDDMILFQRVR